MKEPKEVCWHGQTDKELSAFPNSVLENFAQDLEMLRWGLDPLSRFKPMNGLGQGVMELIKNGRPAYRLVYAIKGNQIHVLHVFSKTSDGTDSKHQKRIKERYKSIG